MSFSCILQFFVLQKPKLPPSLGDHISLLQFEELIKSTIDRVSTKLRLAITLGLGGMLTKMKKSN